MSDLGRYLAFWPMPRGRANKCIDAGDVARKDREWEKAAAHYRRAVTIQPRRRPIWIQLGHAEKEAGRPLAALKAYARASQLPGEDGEAALHLGLQAKALGLFAQAKVSFEKSYRENPAHPGARSEWQEMLHHPQAASEDDKAVSAALLQADQARMEADPAPLIFEVTDLLRHFRNARLPTGVQRVQMEVICAAIPRNPGLRICCFTGADQGWARIPLEQFVTLCMLAQSGGDLFDAAWISAIEAVTASVALAAPVGFAPDDVLVNLGTSWTLPNYFLHIRQAKRRWAIRYAPFVHDVIPVVAPHYCLPDVVRDYLDWIGGVFDHADYFLANSHSTAADLIHVAGRLGHRLDESDVEVVPLDAAISRCTPRSLPISELQRWGLTAKSFVLFVSSIEPRKNHIMAFRAWQAMIGRDASHTPDLVCVGNGGWLNGPIHAALRDDAALAAKVRMLSGISDDELALLYRQCRFTLYPSHYEGWGMPVTEALCHGKVPVVTRCSSLSEAGGDLAVYVAPDDVDGLVGAVEELWRNSALLAEMEARISHDFHPRSWEDVATQIETSLHRQSVRALQDEPLLCPDTLYRMGRNRSLYLVPGTQTGEMLRRDLGWEPLEANQCRTRGLGGILSFRVENSETHVICHLILSAMDENPLISKEKNDDLRPVNLVKTEGWISFEVPVVDGRVELSLRGGVAISHLLISNSASLTEIVARIAVSATSDHAFLRDIYPLVTGREAAPAEWIDALASLEAGGLTRQEFLDLLRQAHREEM